MRSLLHTCPKSFFARVAGGLSSRNGRHFWQRHPAQFSTIAASNGGYTAGRIVLSVLLALLLQRQQEAQGGTGVAKALCTYKATVAYDGTAYKGFQLQITPDEKRVTIQGEIEACLSKMFVADRQALKVQGAGRTDSGVHARGQVVSFCALKRDLGLVRKGMNCLLPSDIRVVDLQEESHTFNARHSATGKIYAYMLDVGPTHDPFMLRYSQHVWRPINVQAMREAAQQFVGRHDFRHFANTIPEGVDPVKLIRSFTVIEAAHHLVRLEVEGSGFLYRQVRHMVGALIAVGIGNLEASIIPQLLEQGANRPPGEKHRGWAVAEAQGLMLEKVLYT